MRLAKAALLLATFALTACSGTVRGTGTSRDGGPSSGFAGSDCTAQTSCDTTVADPGAGAGGSAPSEYDPLFKTPASATVMSNSLDGVWAGTMAITHDDVRLLITPSAITIALRCGSGGSGGPVTTIGTTVKAVTSSTSIRTLDGPSVGANAGCAIRVHPQTFARCSTGAGTTTCFDLSGGSLDFGPNALFTGDPYGPDPSFSKMSDGT